MTNTTPELDCLLANCKQGRVGWLDPWSFFFAVFRGYIIGVG